MCCIHVSFHVAFWCFGTRLLFLACLACCFDEAVSLHPLCLLQNPFYISGFFWLQTSKQCKEYVKVQSSDKKGKGSLSVENVEMSRFAVKQKVCRKKTNLISPLHQGPGGSKPVEGWEELQQRSKQSTTTEKKSIRATEAWKWVEKEVSGNCIPSAEELWDDDRNSQNSVQETAQ